MSRAESVRWVVGMMVCVLAVGCVPAGSDGDGDGDGGQDCPEGQSFNPVSGSCEEANGNNTSGGNNTTGNNTSGGNNTSSGNNTTGNNTNGNNTSGANNTNANNTNANNTNANNTSGANNTNANNTNSTNGTIFGVVTRSASPANGGVGGLYLAVFDGDPLSGGQPVANTLIENVDMNPTDAAIAYQIDDIPVRPDDYFIIGFLDDNGTVDPNDMDSQRPDRGDLVSLQGFGAPSVTVDVAGETEFDIDLNVNMPF